MSHRLDDIKVTMPNGRVLNLVLKHVGLLLDGARAAKPAFLHDPRREILVYSRLLRRAGLGTARCYACGDDWILLEKVPGLELYQIGDLSLWRAAAAWLAHAHGVLRSLLDEDEGDGDELRRRLVAHDAAFYRRWLDRASAALVEPADRRWALALVMRYSEVLDCLLGSPFTVLHGDFNASNILVLATPDHTRGDPGVDGGRAHGPPRVCAVDWEMTGLGPGITDLAALVSGSWGETEKGILAAAYGGVAESDLDVARLQLAVQWLGWSPGWRPPDDHAHDWLGEARSLSEKLGLA